MLLKCIAVGTGGFIGSVCRYLVGYIPIKIENGFPIKTLAINVVGAFLISLIAALATKNKGINPQLLLFLKVGICGGFTTFSTFAFETGGLMQQGKEILALSYVLCSVILSVLAIFLAQLAVR